MVAVAPERTPHPGTDAPPWWADYPYADGVWGPVRPLDVLKKRRNSAECECCHNAPAVWLVFARDHPEAPRRWTAVYQVCHSCRPPEDETKAWKPWADQEGGDRPRLTPVP